LSASKDTNLADHAVENGAHDYLIKNQISPGALRRCVRYSMTRFRVEQSTRRLRAIEDFIATIAHDLKVPVQAMERITRHILNQKDLPEKMSETLRILHLSNQRVLSRLENLLELYKFEFGSVNPEYTKVDLVALLEESLSEKRKALESKEIKILLDLPEQAKVCVDPLLFKKVISEILDNAAKFADPKSTLAVNLRVELDCFKIEIASIGPTIPRGQLKDLFKNFWRGTPGISYVATTGMGLYYCHQVMKMLSGSVACTSLDKTTTVTIKIPNSIS
ncbi:MAG: HAMP domain-containing histidine kinase, partial [Candidatus Obscuribacterales bacterium]|nr:HAMP domain-containing histidine kinase [Candidatus Obscuribacterales bacterium]